jgi:hypothetical protein
MTIDTTIWAAEHSAALVGLPSGAAKQEIAEAGLRSRIAGPDEMLTLEFRPDRITLLTDAADVVTELRPG